MTFTKNITNLLYKIVYLVEINWLLIDSIGGYFLIKSDGNSSVNSIIRGGVLGLIFVLFLIDSRIKYRALPFFVLLLILVPIVFQYFFFHVNNFDFSIIFKLLTLPIFIILIRSQIKLGKLSFDSLKKIITINSLILVGNIILSFYKIGASNYGVNQDGEYVGGTGFFYAGNEVGGTILVLCGLGLFFYSQKGFLKLFVFCSIYLVSALGLLSKTGLLSVGINIAAVTLLVYGWRTILLTVPISGLVIVFLDKIMGQISLFWNRISYFGDRYGWDTLILGGFKRSSELDKFMSLLSTHPVIIFIGQGWRGVLENNFFDVMDAFGLFGYIFFIIPIWFFFKIRSSNKGEKLRGKELIYLNSCLILFVSFFAGHTLQSAMMAPFIAILINAIGFKETKMQTGNE